jgi:hypothetical protein
MFRSATKRAGGESSISGNIAHDQRPTLAGLPLRRGGQRAGIEERTCVIRRERSKQIHKRGG